MTALEFFSELVHSHKSGRPRGIASVCSAHPTVLEAAFSQAARDGLPVLIESTVNQVNQFGGYTGATPEGFRELALHIADDSRFPRDRLILGGDHLGPYPWRDEPAGSAMEKARGLIAACVRAGYAKIHLDASMPLGGDPTDAHGGLAPRVVAEREAELAAAAENAFRDARGERPETAPPVYVIGTEVPAPGGIVTGGNVVPTTVEDLRETVRLCQEAFRARGLSDAWKRVCAVVAQPGVEYGDQAVHPYDRAKAAPLCAAARRLPGMVLEGHSTDYQEARHLRELVEDGVGVLKVGPALTFALRECMFSLEEIEREILHGRPASELSGLSDVLDTAMRADPSHWKAYYKGSDEQQRLARRYSLSDRSRYYWTVPAVKASCEKLFANLSRVEIPLALVSQFLPLHFEAVREGLLAARPREIARESVRMVLGMYSAAARGSAIA